MTTSVQYSDLHIHLLPGLDDGPANIDESLALLKTAWDGGTRRFCATPHLQSPNEAWTLEDAQERVASLLGIASREGIDPEIRLGAEVAIFPELLEEKVLERLPTLGGGRYLLLEAPPLILPPNFPRFLFRLRESGRIPILAHPERNQALIRDPRRMEEIVAAGCRIQVTAGALTGEWGRKVRRTARTFIKEGWVHVVASDGHGDPARLCNLASAEREAAAILGDPSQARSLVVENPFRFMGGEREAESGGAAVE